MNCENIGRPILDPKQTSSINGNWAPIIFTCKLFAIIKKASPFVQFPKTGSFKLFRRNIETKLIIAVTSKKSQNICEPFVNLYQLGLRDSKCLAGILAKYDTITFKNFRSLKFFPTALHSRPQWTVCLD